MIVRALEKKDIPAAKTVWRECFGDSQAFVDNYFANKIDIKDAAGCFDGERLVGESTFQRIKVRLRGKTIDAGFIAGVSTLPEYRYKGVARELLRFQLEEMKDDGIGLCLLQPFLHSFYEKYGFETVACVKKYEIAPKNTVGAIEAETACDNAALLELYKSYCLRFETYIERDMTAMKKKTDELLCDGGRIYMGEGCYAFYFVEEDKVDVIENTAANAGQARGIIGALSKFDKKITIFTPAALDLFKESGIGERHTMARIVDAKKLLYDLGIEEEYAKNAFTDAFCGWNNTAASVGEAPFDDAEDIRELVKKLFSVSGAGHNGTFKNKSAFFDTY